MSGEFFMPEISAIYLALFIAPFLQEDAAVVGSASAASIHPADAAGIFFVSLLGLVLSDAWKYWAGYYAQAWPPAARWARTPKVAALREAVLGRLAMALLSARFIPGTRIPLYLACGVFRAPFHRFLLLITLTGALYLGATFALFATLGDLVGAQFQHALPFIGAGLVVAFGVSLVLRFIRQRANT
ncbi:MAG: hypothetical protein K2P70_01695 [Hyphomonadaceae bacterium]|nr:hypothetical protein [Hyphomonadaceae bacterium]